MLPKFAFSKSISLLALALSMVQMRKRSLGKMCWILSDCRHTCQSLLAVAISRCKSYVGAYTLQQDDHSCTCFCTASSVQVPVGRAMPKQLLHVQRPASDDWQTHIQDLHRSGLHAIDSCPAGQLICLGSTMYSAQRLVSALARKLHEPMTTGICRLHLLRCYQYIIHSVRARSVSRSPSIISYAEGEEALSITRDAPSRSHAMA